MEVCGCVAPVLVLGCSAPFVLMPGASNSTTLLPACAINALGVGTYEGGWSGVGIASGKTRGNWSEK